MFAFLNLITGIFSFLFQTYGNKIAGVFNKVRIRGNYLTSFDYVKSQNSSILTRPDRIAFIHLYGSENKTFEWLTEMNSNTHYK